MRREMAPAGLPPHAACCVRLCLCLALRVPGLALRSPRFSSLLVQQLLCHPTTPILFVSRPHRVPSRTPTESPAFLVDTFGHRILRTGEQRIRLPANTIRDVCDENDCEKECGSNCCSSSSSDKRRLHRSLRSGLFCWSHFPQTGRAADLAETFDRLFGTREQVRRHASSEWRTIPQASPSTGCGSRCGSLLLRVHS